MNAVDPLKDRELLVWTAGEWTLRIKVRDQDRLEEDPASPTVQRTDDLSCDYRLSNLTDGCVDSPA